MLRTVPLNKMGTESDIAKAALFLADSLYITGQTLNVDGGKSL
ncbi:SDR family oxidoreductase [Gammaproteobacteria bacterium]|nr:SDR family oxidoreductase [Gammaproteobacteria bacterium]